jgi:alpha-tubulin suppressor-like RCC1 family protein
MYFFFQKQLSTVLSVVDLACGGAHTLAVGCDGGLYGWGSNSSGQVTSTSASNCCIYSRKHFLTHQQLGIGTRSPFSPTPVKIAIPNGDKVNPLPQTTNYQLQTS